MIPIFDGHNDTLLLLDQNADYRFFERNRTGHIDLPRAVEGGFAGGFFAIFAPSGEDQDAGRVETENGFTTPLPDPLDPVTAMTHTMAMAANLFRLERHSRGRFKVVRTAGEIRACFGSGTVAAVMHIEGAEAIGTDLSALEVFHEAGLRSLGLAWSRPNAFATGVPSSFPFSPDSGPGLTAAGRELVSACNDLRVMIDLSHLNERGFWDVAGLSNAPLVATHSNAHALCPNPRNLTDAQLEAIRESGGMVGLNFAVQFLREDGRTDPNTPLEAMVRHIDHLVERTGIDHVGLGSDFDGATIPAPIGDVSGLPRLIDALREAGYGRDDLAKLAHGNWIRVLEATWGE